MNKTNLKGSIGVDPVRNQFPDPEDIKNASPDAFHKAYDILQGYPPSALSAIAKTLNCWEWDEVLGEKPKNWDNMRNYRKPWMPVDEVTRDDYIRPYMRILCLCGVCF